GALSHVTDVTESGDAVESGLLPATSFSVTGLAVGQAGPSLEPDPEPGLEPDPEPGLGPSLEPDPEPGLGLCLEPEPDPGLEPDPEPRLGPTSAEPH
uniref:Uncharacterized protein n=1 Tax=Xiphophorus maculatus TaxID=8083 RepID=A0A3B5PVB2_XIPMA